MALSLPPVWSGYLAAERYLTRLDRLGHCTGLLGIESS